MSDARPTYAEVAHPDTPQDLEEARAPLVPEIEHSTNPARSASVTLVDVDSPYVTTVPPSFDDQPVQTTTQADRIGHEEQVQAAAKQLAQKAQRQKKKRAEAAGQQRDNDDDDDNSGDHHDAEEHLAHKVQHHVDSLKHDAKKAADAAQRRAADAADKAADRARHDADWLRSNREHPVVITNAVLSTAVGLGLAYGAFTKYRAGQLTWKVAGMGLGLLTAFSVVDFYVSAFFYKKYPPK